MPGVIARPKRTARGKAVAAKLPAANSNSISNFTRVSKLQIIDSKDALAKAVSLESGLTSTIEIVLKSRKRKADNDESLAPSRTDTTSKKLRREPEVKPPVEAAATITTTTNNTTTRKRKTVTFAEPEAPVKSSPSSCASSSPAKLSRKRRLETDENDRPTSPSPSNNPTEAEALFQRLNIQSSPVRKRSKTFFAQSTSPDNDYDLPQELLDLLDMHMAFLKALSMQYAHNGSNASVDLRTLCPSITRSWGKRKVTVDDIRRCIGVLSYSPTTTAPFFLADYGRGKICIELHAGNNSAEPMREQKLNMDFEANLRILWRGRRQGGDTQTAMPLFIATLPKVAIQQAAAPGTNAMPILGKGHRTLEELKNGVVRKQPAAQQTQAKEEFFLNVDGTKMSLLDRIRHKELIQSQAAAAGPSTEELQRRAALQRADDVAAMIGMLSMASTNGGQARIAFTMPVLMTKLKDSLRNPISTEDGAACVRLLAKEIAPQWLRVVTVGGKVNVVVQIGFQPSRAQVQDRVAVLLG
ncbi:hypothetical protein B0H66DRAFT_114947 [Apodospora peruviana]|uniref:DNA replication factor Cdt1 C-terminal domain-containing protein n=1 Tax=Apodospora peruviana TaxID=516989 RepID=A0AAE0MAD0_9PEZI|nr:hypothetical protein B0H66DRAFT_114947 [Apodospora peruviana]